MKAFFEDGGDETDGKNEAAEFKKIEEAIEFQRGAPININALKELCNDIKRFCASGDGDSDYSSGWLASLLLGVVGENISEVRDKEFRIANGEEKSSDYLNKLNTLKNDIDSWLSPTLKEEVNTFFLKDPPEFEGWTPQRRSTLHKTGVQEIARQLWEEHPDATQQEIADHGSIHQYLLRQYQETNRKEYSIRTVTLWVSEVDPRQGQKKGRPAKT